MPELADLAQEALDNPARRMVKVIEAAEEEGWTVGRITVAVRLSRPDDKPEPRTGCPALPFYAIWELTGWTPKTGKPSWHFVSARAKNLQPLSEDDIYLYLEDPSVIYPEPPENVRAEPGEPCYCDYYSFKPHTHPETNEAVNFSGP